MVRSPYFIVGLVAALCAVSLPTVQADPADQTATVTYQDRDYPVRRVAVESLAPAIVAPGTEYDPAAYPAMPAIRVGEADFTTAKQVMALVCGMDPEMAESYGDFGDAVWQDPETGEFVFWQDCPL